jgi:HSP20 family protein
MEERWCIMTGKSLSNWPWGTTGVARSGEADPFVALQREINRAFEGFFDGSELWSGLAGNRTGQPMAHVDVSETEKEVHVTAELPGFTEADLDVELTEQGLRIRGEKKDERETKDHQFHRTERMFGMVERLVPLPAEVQRDGVTATFKNGVLSVVLPKSAPSVTTRKVTVQPAS